MYVWKSLQIKWKLESSGGDSVLVKTTLHYIMDPINNNRVLQHSTPLTFIEFFFFYQQIIIQNKILETLFFPYHNPIQVQ